MLRKQWKLPINWIFNYGVISLKEGGEVHLRPIPVNLEKRRRNIICSKNENVSGILKRKSRDIVPVFIYHYTIPHQKF